MDLSKKLSQWQEAGLIDGDTRARIQAYEGDHQRPLLLYGMLGLGAVTVGLGVISVVAANWEGIGDRTKLAVDLLLAACLGAATLHAHRRRMPLATDVLVGVYYIFTLASIALLGQVYQLGSPTYQALLLWSGVTAPLLTLGRSSYLGALWCAGLTLTFGFSAVEWIDGFSDSTQQISVALIVSWAWLLGLLTASRAGASHRPGLAAGLGNLAWLMTGAAGLCTTLMWYDNVRAEEVVGWALAAFVALAALSFVLLAWLRSDLPPRARHGLSALLALTTLCLVGATGFVRDELELVAALCQMAYLGGLAWTAAQLGRARTFNVLTALIALRVLIIYFEIFGSMLDTGVGMITGGALTLLMAWLWRRKSPRLARQLSGAES